MLHEFKLKTLMIMKVYFQVNIFFIIIIINQVQQTREEYYVLNL